MDRSGVQCHKPVIDHKDLKVKMSPPSVKLGSNKVGTIRLQSATTNNGQRAP